MAGLHARLQVGVGGGEHPHVHALRRLAAHGVDLPRLQHPQQHHLDLRRGLAHFVEEQGASMGAAEVAFLGLDGAGEGALHGAEQLRGHQAGRDGPQVDRHEGTGTARAGLVERPCHELLARARLAPQQHRHVEIGHAAHVPAHRGELVALADQAQPGGRFGREAAAQPVEQQDDVASQLQHHAPLDIGRGERPGICERYAIDLHPRPASRLRQHDPSLGRGLEPQRLAADVPVFQRPSRDPVGRGEFRGVTGEESLPAQGHLAQGRPLSDPAEIRVKEEGESRD